MNSILGWGLALVALVAGWVGYGWPGVAMAVSVVVFWLLLQFSRAVRVMRTAANRPMGRVPSAVMLQAQLKPGADDDESGHHDPQPGPAAGRQ